MFKSVNSLVLDREFLSRVLMHVFAFASFLFLQPVQSVAEVPELINLQGRILADGQLVNGSTTIVFNIYNTPVGSVPQYSETQTVFLVDGMYAADIGTHGAPGTISSVLTNESVFLEFTIESTVVSPRFQVVSTAYALQAASVEEGATETLDAVVLNNTCVDTLDNQDYGIQIGGGVAGARVSGNIVFGNSINYHDDGVGTKSVSMDESGRVGIGNSSPSEVLHVTENVQVNGHVTALADVHTVTNAGSSALLGENDCMQDYRYFSVAATNQLPDARAGLSVTFYSLVDDEEICVRAASGDQLNLSGDLGTNVAGGSSAGDNVSIRSIDDYTRPGGRPGHMVTTIYRRAGVYSSSQFQAGMELAEYGPDLFIGDCRALINAC